MTVRALPTLRFKDPDVQRAYDAIREALQEGNGDRGNPNNRWLTVGDAVNGTVTRIIGSSSPSTPTTPTPTPTDPTPNPPPTPGPQGDGYPPPPPLSLTATADVWAINLEWENPIIPDYLGTEIWAKRTFAAWSPTERYYVNAKVLYNNVVYRAVQGNDASGSSAVNNTNHPPTDTTWWEPTTLTVMANRILVSEVAGTSYTFTGLTGELLTGGETWAFWARNHDIEDLFSTYFPDDDVGVVAKTLLDPGAYLDLLTGSIKETQLYKDLGSRIELIDGSGPGSVNERVEAARQEVSDALDSVVDGSTDITVRTSTGYSTLRALKTSTETSEAGIAAINTVTSTSTSAAAKALWGVQTKVDDPASGLSTKASITELKQTKSDILGSSVSAFTNIQTEFNNKQADIDTRATSTELQQAKSDIYGSAVSSFSNIQAKFNSQQGDIDSKAGVTYVDDAVADAESNAVASATQQVYTTLGGSQAVVQTKAQSWDGAAASYTVKIDNNGYVSGFGLASTPNNGVPYSDFIVRVDRFSVAQPSNPDAGYESDSTIPFIITTSASTINGELVPAGTYIKDAYIKNGTITSAKIGNAQITNAKVGNTIYSNDFNGDPNYPVNVWSSSGWAINKNGQACFNNVRVRGDVLLGSSNQVSNNPNAYGTPVGWQSSYNTSGAFYSAPQIGVEYSVPSGESNLRLYYNANSTAPGADAWSQIYIKRQGVDSTFFPVVGGRSYQFSAYTGAYNCDAILIVRIFDANYNQIGSDLYSTERNSAERNGGSTIGLENWKVLSLSGALGASAAYIQLICHRWGPFNRAAASYARFLHIFFSEIPSGYTYTIPWSPGGISLLDTLGLRANAATVAYVVRQPYQIGLTNNSTSWTNLLTSVAVPISTTTPANALISAYAKFYVGSNDPMRANLRVAFSTDNTNWYQVKSEMLTKIPSSSSEATEYPYVTFDVFDLTSYLSWATTVWFRLEARIESAGGTRAVSDGVLSVTLLKR